MLGEIMAISRLRMASDGEGISTLVAFYGCPLQCRYCANPYCHEEGTQREAYTPAQLVSELSQDDIYFKMTGGGIVFGGGEPLLHANFIHEVCQLADPLWKKRIETSLYSKWDLVRQLAGDIDEWIVDIKDMNPKIYRAYTNMDNSVVISNLKKLIEIVPKEKIWLRIPYIRKYNSQGDVKNSVDGLRKLGFSRLEEFEYIV